MSSTNKTTYYELSQYVGSDKPTYLGDYNSDMLKIDTGLHTAADAADTALTTANAANSAATSASTTASTALSTAQSASTTASQAQTTAETASTNASAALTAANAAETAAAANTITNLAPAYDSTLTYNVGELVTYVNAQGSGKLYKCIVAVTTPEAFNINKWDDVTTSEVFNRKSEVIATITGDGVKTWGECLASLMPDNVDVNSEYILTSITDNNELRVFYHSRVANVNYLDFSDFNNTGTAYTISSIRISATPFFRIATTTTNETTFNNAQVNEILPEGRVLTLLKQSTVNL